MTDTNKKMVKEFVHRWTDKGYEKGESQRFWIDLLQNVLVVPDATEYIVFEEQVKLDHTSFIDGYIEATHVMIEQKSLGKDLRKGIKQSDGSMLSPYQQAVRYSSMLPYSKRPRWIVTCNFSEFLIYDMENPKGEPEQIFSKDLPKEYYRLQFLVDMAWVRTVCGRLKSDYRYSKDIVYNNFPFPAPSSEQRERIERTAQAILNARALYPDCSLADLYDELTMPSELRKAHQANDLAVMTAYGFNIKMTESECVVELMKLYQKLKK